MLKNVAGVSPEAAHRARVLAKLMIQFEALQKRDKLSLQAIRNIADRAREQNPNVCGLTLICVLKRWKLWRESRSSFSIAVATSSMKKAGSRAAGRTRLGQGGVES
jgi:hypothetical protein